MVVLEIDHHIEPSGDIEMNLVIFLEMFRNKESEHERVSTARANRMFGW